MIKTGISYNPYTYFVIDHRGSTALHYAALANNVKITTALISAGADPTIVNAHGYKPAQFAAKEHTDLFEVSKIYESP